VPKARVRNGELTIPLSEEIREKLDLRDGDELDAQVFRGSLTFTPASPEARRQAGQRILELIDQVQLRPGQPAMSPKEVERMVDEEVKTFRRARRNRQQHD
jgi:hypothetical protein